MDCHPAIHSQDPYHCKSQEIPAFAGMTGLGLLMKPSQSLSVAEGNVSKRRGGRFTGSPRYTTLSGTQGTPQYAVIGRLFREWDWQNIP
jgi:hypothetical protein